MQYGVEDGAKQGFARIDAVLAKIAPDAGPSGARGVGPLVPP
jgi:hypothetical protein